MDSGRRVRFPSASARPPSAARRLADPRLPVARQHDPPGGREAQITATYAFEGVDRPRRDADGRGGNPNRETLADAFARPEGGFGAMPSFEPDGAESLGGVETLVSHAPTMTHGARGADARRRAGIGDGPLRVSVGLEHGDDRVAGLERGLRAVCAGAAMA